MTYTHQEEQEFSQKYFPTSFYYTSDMAGKYNEKHARAYVSWTHWAMDIIYGKWYHYRGVKHDLEQAEENYNQMMGVDLEFMEEETWNDLRQGLIDSLQAAKSYNTHAMTFGKAGKCIAESGRGSWGQECLFPQNMSEIIALMPDRHKIVIQGGNIFGGLNKKIDAMIDKIVSPSFRYNRTKKEAIEDEKRRQEYELAQTEASRLKSEAQELAAQSAEAWTKLQENPDSADVEELRTIYEDLEKRKRQMEEEAEKKGILLGLMKDKNRAEQKKKAPTNFQDLWQVVGEELEDKEATIIPPTISNNSSESTVENTPNNSFWGKNKGLLILGGLVMVIILGVVWIFKGISNIF